MRKAHGRVNLGLAVDEQHRGVKNLDFFADHASKIKDMRVMPYQTTSEMGPLYLRTALTTLTCPRCSERVRRNIKHHPSEWFLKFTGRKILYCTNCDWKEIIKEGRWEWETVATVLTTFFLIAAASIVWILR